MTFRLAPVCFATLLFACSRHMPGIGSSKVESSPPATPVASVALSATAAGRHVVALLQAVNAGDSAALLRFASANYDSTALAETGGRSRLLARWGEIHALYGALAVDTVVNATDAEATVWVRGTISRAWLTMRLFADTARAHRVVRIGVGRGIIPPFAAQRVPAVEPENLAPYLDAYIRRLTDAQLFSGVVILARNGAPVLARAYGYSDVLRRVPMSLDIPFDIASVGKVFTATAIAQLAERGALRFEDTIARHLPELPSAIAERITIAHLLEHSSGLGELGPGLDSAMQRVRSVAEMLTLLHDTTLAFPPGTSVEYSNRGYVILGAIVERASGMRYADYVRDHIFAPAGMTRTQIVPANSVPPDRARRYTNFPTLRSPFTPGVRTEFPPERDLAPGPHGGAYSTAPDLQRFARALLSGRLISDTTLLELTRSHPVSGRSRGFETGAVSGRRYYGHLGGAPGMNSMFRVFPDLGYTLVVLSNYDAGANVAGAHITEVLR